MATKRRRTKPQATDSLLAAVEFVSLIQGDTDHCILKDGWCVASDTVMSLGCKIKDDFSACPQTKRLLAALRKCESSLAVAQLDDASIQVVSGGLRVKVPCVPFESLSVLWADTNIAPLDDRFVSACKALLHLTVEKGNHVYEASLLCTNQTISVTNGRVLIEYWHGNNLPPYFVLPSKSVSVLTKINKKISGFGYSGNSCTFHFEDSSWFRTQLYEDKWPNIERQFEFYKGQPLQQLTPGLFDAIKQIQEFCTDKKLTFASNRLECNGASLDLVGLPKGPKVNIEDFLALEGLVSKAFHENGKSFLFGDMTRVAMTTFAEKEKQQIEQIKKRWLFCHPESSSYIEVFTEAEAKEWEGADNGLCTEVTNIEEHEKAYIDYKKQKQNHIELPPSSRTGFDNLEDDIPF